MRNVETRIKLSCRELFDRFQSSNVRVPSALCMCALSWALGRETSASLTANPGVKGPSQSGASMCVKAGNRGISKLVPFRTLEEIDIGGIMNRYTQFPSLQAE